MFLTLIFFFRKLILPRMEIQDTYYIKFVKKRKTLMCIVHGDGKN